MMQYIKKLEELEQKVINAQAINKYTKLKALIYGKEKLAWALNYRNDSVEIAQEMVKNHKGIKPWH